MNSTSQGMSGSMAVMLVFVIGIIAVVIYTIVRQKLDVKENKSSSKDYILKRFESKDAIGGTNLDRFYIEAVLLDYEGTETDDALLRQRVELVAQKYNLQYPKGVAKLFADARKAHMVIREKAYQSWQNAHLSKLRTEEKAEYAELTKYAAFTGRDKRKAMLLDQFKAASAEVKAKTDAIMGLVNMGNQKGADWAVLGGIANGIAGPAAGVAVALDVQRENAKIEERNKTIRDNSLPAYMVFREQQGKAQLRADALKNAYEAANEKLIADMTEQEVFDLLTFDDTQVAVSDSGAFRVSTTAAVKEKQTIGEHAAVVDGTILARVHENGRVIGAAKLVLPTYGISDSEQLKGIELGGAEPGAAYTVTFAPDHLWLMEV